MPGARVREEPRIAFQDVDELVLLRMRVPQRRHAARLEPGQIHAEIRKTEHIAERTLLARQAMREANGSG